MLKLKLQYFGHLMWRTDSMEKTLILGKIEGRTRKGWQKMRWLMASPTQWTRVWGNARSWWWTGRPGELQSKGWQRVGHDWVTELNWFLISAFPFRTHFLFILLRHVFILFIFLFTFSVSSTEDMFFPKHCTVKLNCELLRGEIYSPLTLWSSVKHLLPGEYFVFINWINDLLCPQ